MLYVTILLYCNNISEIQINLNKFKSNYDCTSLSFMYRYKFRPNNSQVVLVQVFNSCRRKYYTK